MYTSEQLNLSRGALPAVHGPIAVFAEWMQRALMIAMLPAFGWLSFEMAVRL